MTFQTARFIVHPNDVNTLENENQKGGKNKKMPFPPYPDHIAAGS